MSNRKIAKRLSTDKPYEDLVKGNFPTHDDCYIIYANGAKWVLKCFITWELYWISEDVDINNLHKSTPDYLCTWLPNSQHYKNIHHIIWHHPNLTDPVCALLYPTWLIKLFWRLKFKYMRR